MSDVTEGDLADLQHAVAVALEEHSAAGGSAVSCAAAIDALIRAHLAAVRDDWLRSAGVVIKRYRA